MNRIYFLSTCDTCKKIMKALPLPADMERIDIKQQNIDAETLDWIKEKVGSYEDLFSKKAQKFRAMGLHEQVLEEADYRRLILEEYTFLKRPFILHNERVFIGNSPKTVQEAAAYFEGLGS